MPAGPDSRLGRQADLVYPLSLTELAFVLVFLMLLLAGWMISREERRTHEAMQARDAAQAELAKAKSQAGPADAGEAELLEALKALRQSAGGGSGQDPEGLISELVNKTAQAELQPLRERIADLDAQLSALTEVRRVMDQAAHTLAVEQGTELPLNSAEARQALIAKLGSALRLKSALEEQLGRLVEAGQEVELARKLAVTEATPPTAAPLPLAAAMVPPDSEAENRDLRGRLAYLQGQLGSRGGRDFPPCWADEATGKVQFLLTVTIHDSGLSVAPAWLAERAADAERLPGLRGLLEAGVQSIAQFRDRAKPLDDDSRAKSCRHYVRLANRARNLAAFNRHRYAVEEFFYKLEVR